MEYFTDAYKKYADFSGRATRTQYWMFILFYMIIYIVLASVDAFLLGGMPVLSGIFGLVSIIPSLSIAVRRLHDTGRSGWWLLLSLIPLIGAIVILIFLVMDSEGDNQYGANPKAA